MRLALVLALALSPVCAFAGGTMADCMAGCSSKAQPCLQGCKDDKCMARCSSQISNCAQTCEGKGTDQKLINAGTKEQTGSPKGAQKVPGMKR